MLLPAMAEHPSYPTPYRFLAACYAHLGRIEEARDIVNRLQAVSSNLLALQNLRKLEHQELLRSGLLIAAGEPE